MRRTLVATALCAMTLLLVSCGSDSDAEPAASGSSATPTQASEEPSEAAGEEPSAEPSDEPSEEATEDASASDPEAVIQQWFAAQRAGDAAAICALEAYPYQTEKYGDSGQPCLDDTANNQPQTVWADPVVIVSLDKGPGIVTAVVQPNASTQDEATVQLLDVDGAWMVGSFY